MGRYAKYHVTRHIGSKIRTGRPSCQLQHSRWGSFTRNNPRILVWKISNVKSSPSRLGLETSLAKVESSRPPQKNKNGGGKSNHGGAAVKPSKKSPPFYATKGAAGANKGAANGAKKKPPNHSKKPFRGGNPSSQTKRNK